MIEEALHTQRGLAITRETTGMKAVKMSYPIGIHDRSAMPVNGSQPPSHKDRYPLRWVITNDTM
jgi:hypothetical protein